MFDYLIFLIPALFTAILLVALIRKFRFLFETSSLNKQAAKEIEQLSAQLDISNTMMDVLLSAASGIIIMTDQFLQVQHLSPQAELFFDIRSNTGPKATLIQVVRDHRINDLAASTLANKTFHSLEIDYVHKSRILRVECLPVQTSNDQPYGTVVAIEDRTELKRLEIVRQEFLNNVSHEIRTPLASIKAMTETLASNSIDNPLDRNDFLNRIIAEVDHLTVLIEEFRMLSNVESGGLPLATKTVTMKSMVVATINRLQAQATAKNIKLVFAEPHDNKSFELDPVRFQQILANLLENSVKFTEPNGSIVVTTSISTNVISVSVKDSGIGIAAEHVSRIFERLYKVDSSRNSSGSGLGLAIAKHLVQTQGGEISVESQLGHGSTFRFSVPVTKS